MCYQQLSHKTHQLPDLDGEFTEVVEVEVFCCGFAA